MGCGVGFSIKHAANGLEDADVLQRKLSQNPLEIRPRNDCVSSA